MWGSNLPIAIAVCSREPRDFAYNDPVTSDFITRLPKAELHLHLEGSVDPLTLSQLSEKHHTPFPWASNRYKPLPNSHRPLTVDEAAALYDYTDFTGFLMAFKAVTERLRDPEDFELITYRLVEKLAAAGLPARRGLRQRRRHLLARAGVRSALRRAWSADARAAEKDFGVSSLLDLRRRAPLRPRGGRKGSRQGHRTCVRRASTDSGSVIGIGIGGDERLAAPELFEQVYAQAARAGLRLSVHAGETVGPPSIYGALDVLKAERLGHALRASRRRRAARAPGPRADAARALPHLEPAHRLLRRAVRPPLAPLLRRRSPGHPQHRRSRHVPDHSGGRVSVGAAGLWHSPTKSCASWPPTPSAPHGFPRSASASC